MPPYKTDTRLGALRILRGMDQKDFAKAMGWKGKQAFLRVSSIESGREFPSDETVLKMAKLLKVGYKRLLRICALTWRDGYLNRKNTERLNPEKRA